MILILDDNKQIGYFYLLRALLEEVKQPEKTPGNERPCSQEMSLTWSLKLHYYTIDDVNKQTTFNVLINEPELFLSAANSCVKTDWLIISWLRFC